MNRRIVLLVVAIVIAAVGAALVFMYVRGVSEKAVAEQEPVRVLTATELITAGESAAEAQSSGKLALTEIPEVNVIAGALTSVDNLSNQLALAPIYPGEQILADKFGVTAGSGESLAIPKNKLAVSVQVTDPARVAGFITPGSHATVFLSADPVTLDPTAEPAPLFTRVLLPDVEVIGVGETTILSTTTTDDSGAQTTEELPKTILTLAVSQSEADKVIFGSTNGLLSFGLLPEDTKIQADPGITANELFQ